MYICVIAWSVGFHSRANSVKRTEVGRNKMVQGTLPPHVCVCVHTHESVSKRKVRGNTANKVVAVEHFTNKSFTEATAHTLYSFMLHKIR